MKLVDKFSNIKQQGSLQNKIIATKVGGGNIGGSGNNIGGWGGGSGGGGDGFGHGGPSGDWNDMFGFNFNSLFSRLKGGSEEKDS